MLVRSLHHRKNKKCLGQELSVSIHLPDGRILLPGDRLGPSPELPDVMSLNVVALPITITLWRPRRDFRDRLLDRTLHRNPIFKHMDPDACLAIDSLHTVYYGPIMRWLSATLWRIVLSNPWRIRGSLECILDGCARRVSAHLSCWYVVNNIPHSRRLGELNLTMMGKRGDYSLDAPSHAGCVMKTKAAETGDLLPWALELLQSQAGDHVPHRSNLVIAGSSLVQWLEVCRRGSMVLTAQESQDLVAHAQRHLLHCCSAGIKFIPKHHFYAEMSLRARRLGNPKSYSCFLDEGLNLILRNVAASCHRTRQEDRRFLRFNLLGKLRWRDCLYGV